jgi:hypothetical protein
MVTSIFELPISKVEVISPAFDVTLRRIKSKTPIATVTAIA